MSNLTCSTSNLIKNIYINIITLKTILNALQMNLFLSHVFQCVKLCQKKNQCLTKLKTYDLLFVNKYFSFENLQKVGRQAHLRKDSLRKVVGLERNPPGNPKNLAAGQQNYCQNLSARQSLGSSNMSINLLKTF